MIIATDFQFAFHLPALLQFLGREQQELAVFFLVLSAEQDIVSAVVSEQLRIADMFRVVFQLADQRMIQFFVFTLLVQPGKYLIRVSFAEDVLVVAGIGQIQRAVFDQSAAAVAALVVIKQIRLHGQAFVFPGHEVFAFDMVPVFQAMDGTKREPLIEKMPLAVKETETVRVVHQTGNRLNVEFFPPDRLGDPVMKLPQFVMIIDR